MLKESKEIFDDLVITEEQVKGSIDRVEAGMIFGWAVFTESSKAVNIHIQCEGKIVAPGCCDTFRQDLKDAGINEGKHAFGFEINDNWPVDVKEARLTMLNAATMEVISGVEQTVEVFNGVINGKIIREEHGNLITHIYSDSPLGAQKINLYHEDKLIYFVNIDTPAHEMDVTLVTPLALRDNQRHLFKVAIEGHAQIIATELLAINAIATPWQYLKESHNKPGFLSLSKQADSRYESLEFQLQAIVKKETSLTADNLLKVHNLIVEGYHGRTKFPAFSLPKFDKPEVSIIVPAYNKFELTYHCIASIALAYNKTSYEVILADDCSTDETTQAADIIENVVISKNPEN
jgi:hypothetical protein